jgi:hypothetical protein
MSGEKVTDIEMSEEGTEYLYTDLIDNQLTVITTMCDVEPDVYDTFLEDRIRAISMAMKIIHKSQKAILEGI